MPPIVPPPDAIRAFATPAELETWLAANHDKAGELYLRIYKKGSDVPTVTYAQALDVALCWGWIDGIKKSFDKQSFLQRFSPRKAKSIWSKINREHIERLVREGRMTGHGLRHVEAAKADGRWDAAYDSASKMEIPADLLAAIEAEPRAYDIFLQLNGTNRYALAFRTHNMKTEAGRRKKIADLVAMLARGEAPYPQAFAQKD